MDRRITGVKTTRALRMQKRQIAATFDYGDVWATVTYTAGCGFQISELHETKILASEAARLGTSIALSNAPYAVVFAVPIKKLPAVKYKRGIPYYATLHKDEEKYSVLLHTSEDKAREAASQNQNDSQNDEKDDKNNITMIGGPISLKSQVQTIKPLRLGRKM